MEIFFYSYAMCEVWCILARIAKMYVEDGQPINESNLVRHKFETIENIIKFPFTSLQTDDRNLVSYLTFYFKHNFHCIRLI